MALQHSWQDTLAHDTRRHRRIARESRAERKAKLTLVVSPRNEVRDVVPLDYRAAHGIEIPTKKKFEWIAAGVVAVALHALAAVVIANLPPAELTAPTKQAPVEIAFVTPPPPPPPPKVEEPPKPKVQKVVKAPQVPVVQNVVPQNVVSDNVVAVHEGPPPAPPAPVEEKVTAARADAGYLNNPPPEYPAVALRQGWSGTVQLRVLVLPDGSPSSINVAKSSGKKVLDDAAIAAVQKWKFVPAKRGDTPIEGWVSFPVEFNIEA
ncbi:MAG: energy transducer TonB [Spongiibacteraceae bacterium]